MSYRFLKKLITSWLMSQGIITKWTFPWENISISAISLCKDLPEKSFLIKIILAYIEISTIEIIQFIIIICKINIYIYWYDNVVLLLQWCGFGEFDIGVCALSAFCLYCSCWWNAICSRKAIFSQKHSVCNTGFTLVIAWLTGSCNSLPSKMRVSYSALQPGKDQNSKFKIQFSLNTYCFRMIVYLFTHQAYIPP